MNKVLLCVVLGLFAIAVTAKDITGTANADTLAGTGAEDNIMGLAGDDNINALAGNDNVWGGAGSDTIDGKSGNDVIYGDDGTETVGFGDDTIIGGDGNDRLYGDEGNDNIRGNAGDDRIDGGEGDDNLNAGSGNDVVYGGSGNDVITQDGGAGAIYPGDGDDVINMNDADPGTEITFGEGLNRINFGPRFGGNVVVQKFSHNDVVYFADCDALYDPADFTTIRTKQGGSVKMNGNGVANKQIFMDRCSCGADQDCKFDGSVATTTGVATTGVATTGVVTTGVATTGVATTGVVTTGITGATTGITGATTTGTTVVTPTVCAATTTLLNTFEAAPPLCDTEALPFSDSAADANAVSLGITRFLVQEVGVTVATGALLVRVRLVTTAEDPCPRTPISVYRIAFGVPNVGPGRVNVFACAVGPAQLKGYFNTQNGKQVVFHLSPRGSNGNQYYEFDSSDPTDWTSLLADNPDNTDLQGVAFNDRNNAMLAMFGRDGTKLPGPAGSASYLGPNGGECGCTQNLPAGLDYTDDIVGVITLENEDNGECHSFYVWRSRADTNRSNLLISSLPFTQCCDACPVVPTA